MVQSLFARETVLTYDLCNPVVLLSHKSPNSAPCFISVCPYTPGILWTFPITGSDMLIKVNGVAISAFVLPMLVSGATPITILPDVDIEIIDTTPGDKWLMEMGMRLTGVSKFRIKIYGLNDKLEYDEEVVSKFGLWDTSCVKKSNCWLVRFLSNLSLSIFVYGNLRVSSNVIFVLLNVFFYQNVFLMILNSYDIQKHVVFQTVFFQSPLDLTGVSALF